MDIHIKNYLKLRTKRDYSLDDINSILQFIYDKSNKFDLSRMKNIENYSENFKYIVDNNISIKYDNSEECYNLKCIDSNYGIFIIDNFLNSSECLNLINLIDNSNFKHFGFTSNLLNSNNIDLKQLFNGKKSIDMDLNDFDIIDNSINNEELNKFIEDKKIL